MSTSSDEAWKEREAAVLALGAIAEGCINGLFPHLPEVIFSFLILIALSYEVDFLAYIIMGENAMMFLLSFKDILLITV